jgi:hypothetical protein
MSSFDRFIKPKQLGQSAASSKCRNHGQGGGNRQLLAIRWAAELRLTPCPDAEVTLHSKMAMGDPRRKLSFGWLETSSVSILTWVIFQKAIWS